MEPDNKIYVGLVVANSDPEMRGRIKIYIPQIGPALTKLNENVDKFFNFIGKNTNTAISPVLEDLKDMLPWAEYAGPIGGGNASGRYNGFVDTGTTSDSNAWKDNQVVEGARPAQMYTGTQTYADAFTQTNGHKNRLVNQYAHQYTPSNYSGLARGLFSIPNVGAHVYTFFINGDRNFPVYFASAYSQEDFKRIYTLSTDVTDNETVDYPKSYENITKSKNNPTLSPDNKTFRSKTVLNSNKHTIEMIDTDKREILKFTHYSGSFKEFNNYASIELATNNDQKMVIGDQFLTVQHNKSEYVRGNNETIIRGDRYLNIGETDVAKVKEILKINKSLHSYKMLFDFQRALYGEKTVYGNPDDMSPFQTRSGVTGEVGKNGMPLYKDGFKQCPVCGGFPYDPYDINTGDGNIFGMWKEIANIIMNPTSGLTYIYLTYNIFERTTMMSELLYNPACHSIAPPPEISPDVINCIPFPHPFTGKIGYYLGMKCACCGGTGFSPSTENGKFLPEPIKEPNGQLDQLILQYSPELFKLEKELDQGGDSITNIAMNKIETIGLVMNDMQSYRVDPIGKLKIDGCWVAPQGTYENLKPSPHVEYVDVADIPGGDYNLTCMNKYKLLVGARGINILTHGPLDIYGTICNYTGEQINISSKNEIVIDGGERLSLRARKISLLPAEHNAIVVEGQLHVTRNTILQGGVMCEGEVALLHITAPAEWQTTETGFYNPNGLLATSETLYVEAFISGIPGVASPLPIRIQLPPHYHPFQNIPLTLLPHKEAVRVEMITKGINSRSDIAETDKLKNATGGFTNLGDEASASIVSSPTP